MQIFFITLIASSSFIIGVVCAILFLAEKGYRENEKTRELMRKTIRDLLEAKKTEE